MPLELFNELLLKKMTRKEFLLHLGLFVVMMSGVPNILKSLIQARPNQLLAKPRGFGNGPYGG